MHDNRANRGREHNYKQNSWIMFVCEDNDKEKLSHTQAPYR